MAMTESTSPRPSSSPQSRSDSPERGEPERATLDRRSFIRGAAATAGGIAGLLSGLPGGWSGRAYASDAPEVPDIRLGFIAVQSAAPMIVAHERGLFKKHGLSSTLVKESGWAAARDKLVSGENHGTHLKFAQSVAASIGLLGSPKSAILAPFTMSRNGSVFMVAKSFKGRLTSDPKSWKATADELKAKGEVFTIVLPVPFGWHGLMYRYFLANAGINADKDLKLVTLPPAQMVQNMRVGTMHACAMVEPWGYRGVHDKVSVITMYGHELWKDHPVKTFAMMEAFADKNPKTARAMLRAIAEAAAWCDNFDNRAELAKLLSPPTYMNSTVESILKPLMGEFDWGDGRTAAEKTQAVFYNKDNYPQPREIKWFLSQFRRWGMTQSEPDYDGLAAKIGRPELYETAMKELGVAPHPRNDGPITLWDGKAFDHKKAAEYARSFAIHNITG